MTCQQTTAQSRCVQIMFLYNKGEIVCHLVMFFLGKQIKTEKDVTRGVLHYNINLFSRFA